MYMPSKRNKLYPLWTLPYRVVQSAKIRLWHLFSPSRHLATLQRRYVRSLAASTPPFSKSCLHLTSFKLLTMTGARHLDCLVESLHSLCVNWAKIPHVKIVTDGSLVPGELANALSFYPGRIEVESIQDLMTRFASTPLQDLVPFAEKHVLGKKLFVIMAHGTESIPHLWTDADILWFGELPPESVASAITAGLALAPDIYPSYAPNMVDHCPQLKSAPYYNSGLVMISHLVPPMNDIRELLSLAVAEPHHFSEQTILADLAATRGHPAWTIQQIHIENKDEHRLPLTPTNRGKPWIARHYASALKQFWRDSVHIRKNRHTQF